MCPLPSFARPHGSCRDATIAGMTSPKPLPPISLPQPNRPNHNGKVLNDRYGAARAMYEGQPGATCATVAEACGVPWPTVKRWKAQFGWKAAVKALPALSAQAAILADRMKVKMSELGKPLDDDVAAHEASRELATEFAVDVRAQVLDRHRKEWAAPRKIIYDAIKAGDFEKAKLAKISSETLTLIQGGECRAYGITLEAKGADAQTVVVVERGGVAPASAGADAAPVIEPTPGTETSDDGGSF